MEKEFAGCPNCGSTEFLTDLNSYDVLSLVDGAWSYIRSELADDNGEYYTCAACGEDVEVDASTEHRKIILRASTP